MNPVHAPRLLKGGNITKEKSESDARRCVRSRSVKRVAHIKSIRSVSAPHTSFILVICRDRHSTSAVGMLQSLRV